MAAIGLAACGPVGPAHGRGGPRGPRRSATHTTDSRRARPGHGCRSRWASRSCPSSAGSARASLASRLPHPAAVRGPGRLALAIANASADLEIDEASGTASVVVRLGLARAWAVGAGLIAVAVALILGSLVASGPGHRPSSPRWRRPAIIVIGLGLGRIGRASARHTGPASAGVGDSRRSGWACFAHGLAARPGSLAGAGSLLTTASLASAGGSVSARLGARSAAAALASRSRRRCGPTRSRSRS